MSKFYFQLDGRSKPTKIAKQLTDADKPADWLDIILPDDWDIDFGANFDAYVYDSTQKTMTPPSNTDTPSLGTLNQLVKDQNTTIADQKKVIDELTDKLQTASGTIASLQEFAGTLTGQVAKANQTIDQLQTMAGSLTGQIAQLKLSQTTDTKD